MAPSSNWIRLTMCRHHHPNRPARVAGIALFLGLLGVWAVAPASAQFPVEWDAAREQVTRAELQDLLERLEDQAMSPAYSSRMRGQARQSIELIQQRLEQGDFQVGDRIVLDVQGEPDMSDTLLVRSGRVVEVPLVGPLSLDGLLRSELQEAMEAHLRNYIRSPVLRTQALLRVSVLGAVGSPGFYTFPADMPITDVLMRAGGPGANPDLTALRVERGNIRIWEGESMEMAVIQGRTLDQMNIQAGDRLVVPVGAQARSGWETFRLVAMTAGSVSSLIFLLTRIF